MAKRPKSKPGDPLWLRALPFISVIVFLAIWEWVVKARGIAPIILPAPSAIADYLWLMIADGSLPYHLTITFLRIMGGFLVAGVLGIALGVLMGMSRVASRVLDPWIAALYPRLMQENPRAVAGFVSDASFQDIGMPGDCLATSLALARDEGDQLISPRARVEPTAVLENTAVWDDVEIGADAHLVECIVADGARVPDGMALRRCAVIPANAREAAAGERIERGLLIHPF